MTSNRQRLQSFHDVGPGVSSPYNSAIHIYSEGNLSDKNFSFTQATPYNSDHLTNDHSLLQTTDDGTSCSTSLQGSYSILNNSTSSSIASTSQAHVTYRFPFDENVNNNTCFETNTTHRPIAYQSLLIGQSEYKKKQKSEFTLKFPQLSFIFLYLISSMFFFFNYLLFFL